MKKILIASALILATQNSFAYTPFPLSFEWFGSIAQSLKENDQEVWRGTITEVISSNELMIKNINGHTAKVKLLHLSPPENSSSATAQVMTNALSSLIGNHIYVLGTANKDEITARLIDKRGHDINLEMVKAGAFDVNTTSLIFKDSKKQYLAAVQYAKRLQKGIWYPF